MMHNGVMVVKIGKTPMSFMPVFVKVLFRKVEENYSGKVEQLQPLLSVFPDDPVPVLKGGKKTEQEPENKDTLPSETPAKTK